MNVVILLAGLAVVALVLGFGFAALEAGAERARDGWNALEPRTQTRLTTLALALTLLAMLAGVVLSVFAS